jgi:hypothetical protein
LRRPVREVTKVIILVIPRERVKDVIGGDTLFGSLPRLLQQRALAEEGTKLLRAVIAEGESRESPEADTVTARQNDAPAAFQRDRFSRHAHARIRSDTCFAHLPRALPV